MRLLKRLVVMPFLSAVLMLACRKGESWPAESYLNINEGGTAYSFKGADVFGSISPARTLSTTGFIYTTGLIPASPISFSINFNGGTRQTTGNFPITDCSYSIHNTFYHYANRNSHFTVTRINEAATAWEGEFSVEVVDNASSNPKLITGTFAIKN